jgi:hypothetical protein
MWLCWLLKLAMCLPPLSAIVWDIQPVLLTLPNASATATKASIILIRNFRTIVSYLHSTKQYLHNSHRFTDLKSPQHWIYSFRSAQFNLDACSSELIFSTLALISRLSPPSSWGIRSVTPVYKSASTWSSHFTTRMQAEPNKWTKYTPLFTDQTSSSG